MNHFFVFFDKNPTENGGSKERNAVTIYTTDKSDTSFSLASHPESVGIISNIKNNIGKDFFINLPLGVVKV